MTGSQIRKEKETFEQLYQLELALRKEKEGNSKYASEVVTSKKYRDEITDDKKEELIKQMEDEKMQYTVTTNWQPNALLCKRFGLLDPFMNKQNKVHDFNRDPKQKKYTNNKIEFVDQGESMKGQKGDEFFYKIQRGVGRISKLQEQLNEGEDVEINPAMANKVKNLSNSNYLNMDSDSDSDMDGIEEATSKHVHSNVINLSKKSKQEQIRNIFNSDEEC